MFIYSTHLRDAVVKADKQVTVHTGGFRRNKEGLTGKKISFLALKLVFYNWLMDVMTVIPAFCHDDPVYEMIHHILAASFLILDTRSL